MDVVVGYKNAEQDRGAVEHAGDECRRAGGALHLVSYVDFDALNPQSVDAATSRAKRLRGELEELAEEIRAGGLDCTPHFVSEPGRNASDVVLAVAEDVGARLIVVTVRHRSRVGKAFLGSSAQDILLRADVPVLAVNAD